MAKKKYYVVWVGETPGIYENWDDCKAQVDGFAQASYKSYKTRQEADFAFKNGKEPPHTNKPKKKKKDATDIADLMIEVHDNPDIDETAIVVDAACSGNPGVVEYRCVSLQTYEEVFRKKPMPLGTNNMGEFLAIVHALSYCKQKGLSTTIYSDSDVALGWVKKKVMKSKLERNEKSEEIWGLTDRALTWLKENTYANKLLKWDTENWGEIPADYGRK